MHNKITEEKSHNATEQLRTSEIKHAAMQILAEAGMGNNAIARALDYHEKHVSRVLPELRKESLQHPHKLKLASKTVDAVMKGFIGEPVKGPDKKIKRDEGGQPLVVRDLRVKPSDAIRAAELVYSRAEPVKEDGGSGVQQTFLQVNMAMFRRQD